jgi:hypothetical protein
MTQGDIDQDAVAHFVAELKSIPWLKNVGKALPAGSTAKQMQRWEDWPGPEEPAILELSTRFQGLYDHLIAESKSRGLDLSKLCQQAHDIVFESAASAVPYHQKQDCYHGPTAAVWQAACTAELVVMYVATRRSIPDDVQEQWKWFVDGHWPAGYTVVWADERLGPLLVY